MVERRRPRPCWNVALLTADMTLRGWNAQDFARRARIAPKTVNRFLDESVQTTKTAKKLARALGHPLDRYLSHVEAIAS